ncbi:MAG: hypothetical protein ACREM3_13435 [Candidatus Rokuibacteriota bacterium]
MDRQKTVTKLVSEGKLPSHITPIDVASAPGPCSACGEFGAGRRTPQGSTMSLCGECFNAWQTIAKK